MTELRQIYKCEVCGNIVEVRHSGAGELVCCGQPMLRQIENTVDAAKEKHVPVIEKTDTGYKVSVGSEAHPMSDEHHIEWIEIIADGRSCFKRLKPGDEPSVVYELKADSVEARAYCNLHGLWKK